MSERAETDRYALVPASKKPTAWVDAWLDVVYNKLIEAERLREEGLRVKTPSPPS